jgi:predicted nucleic acid-binding protein
LNLVIDASVAVEYLLRTPLGQVIAPTVEGAELYAPELIDVEVMSALRRLVLANRLDLPRAALTLDLLRDWPLTRLPHASLIPFAWTYRNCLSAYDAFYVAAARALEAELVTADGALARAPALDVVIHNIRGRAGGV